MKYQYIRPVGFVAAMLSLLTLVACGGGSSNTTTAMRDSCVLIDNDFDIDDMMAIPLVVGNKYVAAIVQSEGYTLPEQSAPVIDQLVNNIFDQPNNRRIPIIVGGKQNPGPDLNKWPWLGFFRAMMNQANALLSSVPTPWQTDSAYTQKVVDSVASCKNVSVLLIGTYTSFINYSPLIRDKIDKVVIMGQPIGDSSRTPGKESFNCNFDLAACKTAMTQLQGLNKYFVDIPRDNGEDPNLPKDACLGLNPSPNCYNPSYEMVAGGNGSTGLLSSGLAGRLKQSLMNPIDCNSKYTAGMPSIPSAPESQCSALSTWVPANVAAGPGGEMLLWDETAALFMLHPEQFSLYYPPNNPSVGGKHYEPNIVNNSYADTAARLRQWWTEDTNRSALPR